MLLQSPPFLKSQNFGDLTEVVNTCGLGDTVRAVVGVTINTIDYINISTGGDATDFGDMTTTGWNADGGGVSMVTEVSDNGNIKN